MAPQFNNGEDHHHHQHTGDDGFDGVYSGNHGYFNNASSPEGVELELMSNTSSHTRHNNNSNNDRAIPDHHTSSDASSQAPDHRPLISGEPLLQGIGEVAQPVPSATVVDDSGKYLRRRTKQHQQQDDTGFDTEDGGYRPYEPPIRYRSMVRPERGQDIPNDPQRRMRTIATNSQGASPQTRGISIDANGRKTHIAAAARRRRSIRKSQQQAAALKNRHRKRRFCASPWQTYCRVVTFWAPGRVLKCFGMPDELVQMAWREKMGLVSLILLIMAAIAFLTFGFQQVLCGLSGTQERIKWNEVGNGYAVVDGRAYDITHFKHGPATPWTGAANANIAYQPANAGGKDLSFLFQNPNSHCKGILGYDKSTTDSNGNVVNVFPCVYYNNTNKIDPNQIPNNQGCHNTHKSRQQLSDLHNTPVQYSWDDVRKQPNLVVYNGAVLNLAKGQFLLNSVHPPKELKQLIDGSMKGKDVSLSLSSGHMKQIGRCANDLFRVGSIDSSSLGCMASNIVLYVSLIVILGGVLSKFFMAIYFGWFMGPSLGKVKQDSPEDRKNRQAEIEAWADINNHYGKEKLERKYTVMGGTPRDGTQSRGTNRKSRFFPTTSRYSHFMPGDEPGARDNASSRVVGSRPNANNRASSIMPRQSAFFQDHRASQYSTSQMMLPAPPTPGGNMNPAVDEDTPLSSIANNDDSSRMDVQQLPPQHVVSPWNFELAYTLLLVTCYSEGAHGIRTTLDSLCGTDYPASHKCLFIICDGLIKGAGEDMYTPDVVLSMMTDFVIPPDRVRPYTYVSIAQGAKRHNMAKLYAGYYAPNENSPKHARENKVPMILVVKCGKPEEASEAKPGNRGKRDSQIILMSFLQRVMFDERMTELEYELFNAMWNVTGVTPDNFEIVLMVDADTKVYVDSVTRMVKAMVDDPTIMGQCGETKIANKTDSWVTMIQVFEYYIAHHQSKAFESVFGGVTCLPGCFCMYRIKAPKGQHGYWVPILANPDIVENYSENVVDTLHKKNLLLLGEDRYLSTLMLRTFPKRKMMFIPSSVCKTIVPDEFKVLLSQRRRWINSTVHNLGELVMVNDLCGTFCLSMQFIIFMDLIGTLALPAAIVFTLYIIIISTFTRPVPWLPLSLLAVILGLPAVLIGLTSRKLVYIGWMLIYLCSLPIWNFVLPTYSYWHFDDFSWGQTRMVQGEGKDKGHGDGDGEFDSTQIVMKRWCDFEADKRRKTQVILGSVPSLAALAVSHSHQSSQDLTSSGRQSRVMVPSRPVSVVSSSPRQQGDNVVSSVGHAAALQQAASQLNDADAEAAAGSIERLGYMTPNIIPALASQQGLHSGYSTPMLRNSTSGTPLPPPSAMSSPRSPEENSSSTH